MYGEIQTGMGHLRHRARDTTGRPARAAPAPPGWAGRRRFGPGGTGRRSL